MKELTEKRFLEIDFLRAIAIFLMTLTHVNSVFLKEKDPVLDIFTTLGSLLCFSIFLFCSAYISGIKIEKGQNDSFKKVLFRVLKIYVVYLFLALLVQYSLTKDLSLSTVLNIILLKTVPEFTDFLIAFIVFSLLTKILFNPLRTLQKKPIILLSLSILILFFAQLLFPLISQTHFPEGIRILIENIFGYQQLHRFPVAFYLVIFSLGIILSVKNDLKTLQYTLLTSTVIILILRLFNLSQWNRWPPSILFLTYGIFFISFLLIIFQVFNIKSKLTYIFLNVGKYPLEQFFLTTFLIFSMLLLFEGEKTLIQTVFINLFVLSTSVVYPIVLRHKMI